MVLNIAIDGATIGLQYCVSEEEAVEWIKCHCLQDGVNDFELNRGRNVKRKQLPSRHGSNGSFWSNLTVAKIKPVRTCQALLEEVEKAVKYLSSI